MDKTALVLSGGGARAAYQVGVLQAVSEIHPNLKWPFPIISGTSAGAVNAAALAAHPGTFKRSAHDLARTWQEMRIEQVFRTDFSSLTKGACNVVGSLMRARTSAARPIALLDNQPLRELLKDIIHFKNIGLRIQRGSLDALAVTALGYSSGESVSFFQGRPEQRGWRRYRRVGAPNIIGVEHLMASSAIPIIFPAIKLKREYFGDGAMRQIAPISSALHLGANRLFIVGVSGNRLHGPQGRKITFDTPKTSPSIGNILGHVLNSAFIDSLEGDIEQLDKINYLLGMVPEDEQGGPNKLRNVETLVISPSRSLESIAETKIAYLPKAFRFFLNRSGVSSKGGGASTASYLLFAHEYCAELIELGYHDAMAVQTDIKNFFRDTPTKT